MIGALLLHWKTFAALAFVAAVFAAAYGLGHSRASDHYKVILLEQQKAYDTVHLEARNALDAHQMELNARLMMESVVAAERSRKRDVIVQEVTKWRTRYAKNPDAGRCHVPAEFVCITDATILDDVSETAEGACRADAGPSGISDVELLSFITDAKRTCLQWRDQLMEWQARERVIQQ